MVLGKAICFFKGHRRNIKFQITQGYKIYICDRCHSLFAVRKDVEDMQTKKRIEKAQSKEAKKQAKIEKKEAKVQEKLEKMKAKYKANVEIDSEENNNLDNNKDNNKES